MLTSEFQNELSALIRQLQLRIAEEPALKAINPMETQMLDAKAELDRAIIRLVALRLSL